MALLKRLYLVLTVLIAAVATAIRYELIAPAIISQLVAGNEFEWMLGAFLLVLVALLLRCRS